MQRYLHTKFSKQDLILQMHFPLSFNKITLSPIFVLILLSGCLSEPTFQISKEMDRGGWTIADSISGSFKIGDTESTFQLEATSWVTEDLPTYNHYIFVSIYKKQSKEVLFSGQYNLDMFRPENGEPLGSKSENSTHRTFILLKGIKFKNPGEYELKVKQLDRLDPMPGVQKLELKLVNEDT